MPGLKRRSTKDLKMQGGRQWYARKLGLIPPGRAKLKPTLQAANILGATVDEDILRTCAGEPVAE